LLRTFVAVAFVAFLAACSSRELRMRMESVEWLEEPLGRHAKLATGIDARWIELGNPRGEPVLFLHGYTDTSRSFLPAMRALAGLRPDLRLIALDQRGHGGTSLPVEAGCRDNPERCFGMADLAADALAFLDHLEIARASVVGHSMGSVVAQELALEHPERVTRIVLIGSTARMSGNPVLKGILQEELVEGPWKRGIEERGLRFPADAWARMPGEADPKAEAWIAANWVAEPGTDPAFLGEVLPETARTPLATWIGALRGQLEHDNVERLAELRTPALVLWSIQDPIFVEEDQRLLRASLARATAAHGTTWFWKRYGRKPATEGAPQSDLGHNLQWAAFEPVARDLAAFLRDGGAPTKELAYLAGDVRPAVRIAPGEALVIGSDAKSP
jgi:pimeloyl-ACP methyl ester carboxylesterase